LSDFDGNAAAIQTHLESTKVFICNFPLSFFVPSKIRLGFKFFCIPKFHVGLYLYLLPTLPTKELFGKHWCNIMYYISSAPSGASKKSDSELFVCENLNVACKKVSSPITGPEGPRGFQEVKVPIFRDNGTGWW